MRGFNQQKRLNTQESLLDKNIEDYTIKDCEDFLAKYPNDLDAEEVRERMKMLSNPQIVISEAKTDSKLGDVEEGDSELNNEQNEDKEDYGEDDEDYEDDEEDNDKGKIQGLRNLIECIFISLGLICVVFFVPNIIGVFSAGLGAFCLVFCIWMFITKKY